MKASDLLVACLEEEGIQYIFGVPGEENADFMLSLEDSRKITFILTRHEQGAAFMAEVYGRLTGNPAGCLGTLGPGASNLITGVADANMDRAPMLVLTGQGATRRLHKESHQVMDVVAMFEPVTKWAISIRHPDTIPEIVRKAVRLARMEKPGAVHIELPEDLAKLLSRQRPMVPRRFHRSIPDPGTLNQAFELLAGARRPVILAGNGCIRKRSASRASPYWPSAVPGKRSLSAVMMRVAAAGSGSLEIPSRTSASPAPGLSGSTCSTNDVNSAMARSRRRERISKTPANQCGRSSSGESVRQRSTACSPSSVRPRRWAMRVARSASAGSPETSAARR